MCPLGSLPVSRIPVSITIPTDSQFQCFTDNVGSQMEEDVIQAYYNSRSFLMDQFHPILTSVSKVNYLFLNYKYIRMCN